VADSKIEWTDATWNPVTGCTRASAGCDNCYAVTMTKRLEAMGQEKYSGLVNIGKNHFNGVVKCHEDELLKPLGWRKPRRVFVNSMSDLFHKEVPFAFIDKVFAVMALCPQHTFQVLTKRPERMAEYLVKDRRPDWAWQVKGDLCPKGWRERHIPAVDGPLPNVWLGTSVEDQKAADERIPHLLRCPAAVRFLSCEPLIGPISLEEWDGDIHPDAEYECMSAYKPGPLDWVIAGGESGPNARPMHPDWARSLRDQCQASGVPFFFKQWGAYQDGSCSLGGNVVVLSNGQHASLVNSAEYEEMQRKHLNEWNSLHPTTMARVGKKAAGRLLDGRTWDEFPEVQGG